jgi:SAM-dependent methyltransferase
MKDWVEYYDSAHSIYVNARHRDVHYARLADEIAAYVPSPSASVLDYGCGEALSADRIAKAAGRVTLVEAAQSVRAHLIARFKLNPKIMVISNERVALLPEASLDLVVMNSVAQYLTTEQFERTVALFHRLLKPGGLLLVGDVIPPYVSAVSDAWALLRFGWREGFFFAAVIGLLRTLMSDYRRLRVQLGLTRYTEQDMIEKLWAAGFAVSRAPANLGHLTTRMTFLARKAAQSALAGSPAGTGKP